MATVRDSAILVIGLEFHRADNIVAPIRTELKAPCRDWNLLFLPIGRADIAAIPTYVDRHAKDLDVIYVMNDADLTCNDVLEIATNLARSLPMHPRNAMVSCESRLLRDILNGQLEAAGIVLHTISLNSTIKERYRQLHPLPDLKLVSAA
jgi:hypothetical protein